MTLDELEAQLEGSEALFLEPRDVFDAAIIGITEGGDGVQALAYDSERVVQALMDANDWDEEEAREWYELNTAGAYVGPAAPVFIQLVNQPPKNDSSRHHTFSPA